MSENTKSSGRIFGYDLIRAAAVIMIVLYHMSKELAEAGYKYAHTELLIGRSLNMGKIGTSIFFILSGAVQCLSWERITRDSAVKGKSGSFLKDTVTYYKKRWLNIFPMFYLAYVLGHVISILHLPGTGIARRLFWSLLGLDGYLQMLGVSTLYVVGEWFLGVILILFLLFPFLYTAMKQKPWITGGVLVLVFVLFTSILPQRIIPDINILVRSGEFGLGIAFHLYFKKMADRWPKLISILSGAILSAIGCLISLWVRDMYAIVILSAGLFLILFELGNVIIRPEEDPADKKTRETDQAHGSTPQAIQADGNLKEKPLSSPKMGWLRKGFRKVVVTLSTISFPIFLMHRLLIKTSLESWLAPEMSEATCFKWGIYLVILILVVSWILQCAGKQAEKGISAFLSRKR